MQAPLHIKICGLKTQDDITFCTQSGVSFIGFVFCPSSPRYITPQQVAMLEFSKGKASPKTVAVFKNPSPGLVQNAYEANAFDYIQIHSTPASLQFIEGLKAKLSTGPKLSIGLIVALTHEEATSQNPAQIQQNYQLAQIANFILIDSATPGSGQKFDWRQLPKNQFIQSLGPSFFLAGGINQTNLAQAAKYTNYLDISSGVESSLGIKCHDKIAGLMEYAKSLSSAQ